MNYKIIVDKDHPITEEYLKEVKLIPIVTDTDNKKTQIEKETYEAFLDMRDYLLLKENITIGIDSAYRSVEYQEKLMQEFTDKYGEEYARETVAEPGTSEHHTGLAIDICPKILGQWITENEDMIKMEEVFDKIHRALPIFGFRLTYPKENINKPGSVYEPWHIRYTGGSK